MTDLQLGLLVIGAIAVVGVFAFNRVQERRARQDTERAFAVKHPDALLNEPAAALKMRGALEGARELAPFCAAPDIRVALPWVGITPDATDFAGKPFQATPREDGFTLTLDVARTAEPRRSFEAMARAGHQLAG